ncbi:hypothetical protein, partial [Nostoc sp.]
SSLVNQAIANTAGNSTQITNPSLNLSNVSSLARQVISDNNLLRIYGQTANNLTSQTISSFNNYDVSSLVSQGMSNDKVLGIHAETVKYLTSETIASSSNSDFNSPTDRTNTETAKYLIPAEGNNGLAIDESDVFSARRYANDGLRLRFSDRKFS